MPGLSLIACGRCGKPRGLRHTCTSSRKGPAWRWKAALTFTCPTCRKQVPSLLTHTCTIQSDFRKRKAAQARAAKAAERKRRRRAAAARRKAAAKTRRAEQARKRRQAQQAERDRRERAAKPASHDRQHHDYAGCTDPDCSRYPCRVYRQGRERGHAEGRSEGFAAGYAEGASAALQHHGG